MATNQLLLTIVGCGAFWTFAQYLLDKIFKKRGEVLTQIQADLKEINERLNNDSQLTLAISRDRINHLTNKYLAAGYIPLNEYDSFLLIGESYLNNGGNSVVKDKFEKCLDLPVK